MAGSPPKALNVTDLKVIRTSSLLVLGASILTLILQWLLTLDFGENQVVVGGFIFLLLETTRSYLSDTRTKSTERKKLTMPNEHIHELATVPDVAMVVKGLQTLGELTLAKEFTDPCFTDWLLEVIQHSQLLLRGQELHISMRDASLPLSADAAATSCFTLADEFEAEMRQPRMTAAGADETAISPATIALLIRAIMMSRTLFDLLPDSVKDRVRKILPWL